MTLSVFFVPSPLDINVCIGGHLDTDHKSWVWTKGRHEEMKKSLLKMLWTVITRSWSPPWELLVSHRFITAWGLSGITLTAKDLSVWRPYVLCLLDSEARCRTALTDWLLRYREQTYYDRLSRALQHIGRTDIAIGEMQMEIEITCFLFAQNDVVWIYQT